MIIYYIKISVIITFLNNIQTSETEVKYSAAKKNKRRLLNNNLDNLKIQYEIWFDKNLIQAFESQTENSNFHIAITKEFKNYFNDQKIIFNNKTITKIYFSLFLLTSLTFHI